MDSSSNFPVLVIAIIGILATAFLLLGYYIFVIKCCLNWHRSPNHPSSDPQPAYSESAITRGLDDSLIRLIPVIRFRKEAKKTGDKTGETGDETEYLECSVCLSDFKEGEKLRVIPNCCHAFHIDCIDVWLQGNANCPVCRSCISSHTLSDIGRVSKRSNRDPGDSGRRPSPDRFTGNDDDYVVIEILHNNLDDPVLVRGSDSGDLSPISIALSPWKTEHGKQSCDDECVGLRVEEDEFDRVHPIRRSVSMDLSRQRRVCSEIREAVEQSKKQSNEGRSFFSFGGRGGSRSAVLPLQLDS